jgi:hypothetical protein
MDAKGLVDMDSFLHVIVRKIFLTFFLRNMVRKIFAPLANFSGKKVGAHLKMLREPQEVPLRHCKSIGAGMKRI